MTKSDPLSSLVPTPYAASSPAEKIEPFHRLSVINDIANQSLEDNPAAAYLVGLSSKRSRQTMQYFLAISARMLGYQGIHDCPWGQLRRHHVTAMIELLRDNGKAPATINTYLSGIKGVAREAWIMQQMDTESYQFIKDIRGVRGSRLPKGRGLARWEIKQLFEVCDNDQRAMGLRDGAIFGILLGCGLRRSEIVAIDHHHIDYRSQAILVIGKGDKQRISYLPDGSWSRLNLWIEQIRSRIDGPLFSRIRRHDDVTDQRMTDQAIYHILHQRRLEAGIEPFSPHDLRRTFASAMLDNGEDIVTVKDAMGHANINTTQRYDRRGDERLKRASKRLVDF